ncbi:MAG: hypothetical protein IKQ17_14900 [Kiritimatiellae bacterium]|nr:hypothetical protein [Kiritimatiellia bacterium]
MKIGLGALALAACLCIGCSKEEAPLPEAPVSKPVADAMAKIVDLVVPDGGVGVSIAELDVSNMTADGFLRKLEAFDVDNVTVWMPGETHWLLVGWNGTNRVSLAAAMDVFAMDDEDATSPTDVFSSYVGTIEDILPAFGSRLEGNVLPEWFVTKEIPTLKWLDTARVDRDILRRMNAEIRSMQVVRRLILEGNIAARSATDKKGEEEAAEKWAKAMLRNPRDPMLLERLDRLERNAKGFLEVGKVLQAMKCYETIILVNPKDAVAIHNFGLCLRKIGKSELAEKVLERARELAK